MQYVGKVGGYVYNQWNSLNPATLSGAIDIIVVEQPDGSLYCSPWHVRFGKFQIIKPSQKKIDLYVNNIKTDLPMKLGDGGEAFFVFETDNNDLLSQSVLTSPVISPSSSPSNSPSSSPKQSPNSSTFDLNKSEPDLLDLNNNNNSNSEDDVDNKIKLVDSPPSRNSSKSNTPAPTIQSKIAFEKARKITQKLNIPSKIDINGDMVLDMDGYKPNSQKNIDNSDELFKKIFLKEINELSNNNGENEFPLWDQIISKDENGNIRILNNDSGNEMNLEEDLPNTDGLLAGNDSSDNEVEISSSRRTTNLSDKTYFKTLRLTSEQLQKMNLNYGENELKFRLSEGNSQIVSYLYLWKSTTPIVISDIDGTITKSDALGHVLNLFGKDWTHPGVANLFQDIRSNGYNIIYLTARSVGQADTTRQYLRGISQDGVKLPKGPVILSPDRTIAALKREVILKKPEVFKMSCLSDIKSLYFNNDNDNDDDRTPFYAGFGNRITDAISYRSVKIPSHRIFTINPNGEVHMELLELAGYKSSYLHIGELVDHFFPPVREVSDLSTYWNDNQLNEYISNTKEPNSPPKSPGSPRSIVDEEMLLGIKIDEKFNDVNYWREPINLSDLSDIEDEETTPPEPKSPSLLSIRSFGSSDNNHSNINESTKEGQRFPSSNERPNSMSSFTSPLKNFMMFGGNSTAPESSSSNAVSKVTANDSQISNDSDYTDAEDEDYTDDEDYEDDEDYTDDDYEDDDEEDEEDDDYDEEEDLDYGDDALPDEAKDISPSDYTTEPTFIKASEFNKLTI